MKAGFSHCLAAVAGAALLLAVGLAHAAKAKPDATAAMRAAVRETVADPERQAKLLAAVDEVAAVLAEMHGANTEKHDALVAMLADYGSTRAAVDAALAEFDARREAIAGRVVAAHAALKAQATAAEWKKLRKPEMDMITAAAAPEPTPAPGKER